MSKHALIVIGTSAGGIPALMTLVKKLPKDLDAPICVARHAEPARASGLPDILTHCGTVVATYPRSGAHLLPAHLFLAPPDQQLLIDGEQVTLTQKPPQQPRDDIDHLFESAAISQGPRVIAVILTGMLTDGTRGLQAVKEHGGTTIIQDPNDAAFPSMPRSAQDNCHIDYCLPLDKIALLLQQLVVKYSKHLA